jgi:diguanylate cyclase (GGDEF)-like protein
MGTVHRHRRAGRAVRRRVARRRRKLAPFAAAAALPFAFALLPGSRFDTAGLAVGGLLTLLVAGSILAVPWDRWPDWTELIPVFGYLVAIGVLRDAGGGNESGLGPLALVPVMWLALHGSRRVLAVTLGGVGMVYWLPMLLFGVGARYPASGFRIGLLITVLAAILGFTVQALHDKVRAQADQLRRLAHTDELTGLPNRRAWDGALDAAIAVAARREEPLCVALVDIDGFKAVNDSHGHEAGDALLAAMTAAWLTEVRRGDTLARTGGDEFAVLLPDCSLGGAFEVLERMQQAGRPTTASVGLAQWDGAESAVTLTRRADAAMYEAKAVGRDRIVASRAVAVG